MPVHWYVVRVISGSRGTPDLVQVVSCSKTEKAAEQQLQHTKENVDLSGMSHRYLIWESSGNNVQREVDRHVNHRRSKKVNVVGDAEIEEFMPGF